ncbi:MAG: shikimate kinase [Terriglobales bacterium]
MKKPGTPRAVFLTGFMGAGKSSTGRALARRLGWSFIDLDRSIEKQEGTSIARIFEQRGEVGFRKAEAAALRNMIAELKPSRPAVVALGGGTLTIPGNRRRLRQHGGPLIFLDAPLSTLLNRGRRMGRRRPLFANPRQFRQLYQARLLQYRRAAIRISTWRKHPKTVAAMVAAALGLGPRQEVR